MAKAFSEAEKRYIKQKLKSNAKECLKRYGIKKTSVDELTRLAAISKGAFYLFYPSKELLLFEVITEFHDEIQKKLLLSISEIQGKLTVESFTNLLFDLYKLADESFLPNLLNGGEMEYLFRKLPATVVKIHHDSDNLLFSQLSKLIPSFERKNTEVYTAAFRAVFLTMLHKREIGETQFEDVLKILLRGIALQALEE